MSLADLLMAACLPVTFGVVAMMEAERGPPVTETVSARPAGSGEMKRTGYFLKASSMLPFEETWRAGGDGIVLGAIDHPEDRQFGNLYLDLRGRPGKRLPTFPLSAEGVGNVRRADQHRIRGFADLRVTGPSQFTALSGGSRSVPPIVPGSKLVKMSGLRISRRSHRTQAGRR